MTFIQVFWVFFSASNAKPGKGIDRDQEFVLEKEKRVRVSIYKVLKVSELNKDSVVLNEKNH